MKPSEQCRVLANIIHKLRNPKVKITLQGHFCPRCSDGQQVLLVEIIFARKVIDETSRHIAANNSIFLYKF